LREILEQPAPLKKTVNVLDLEPTVSEGEIQKASSKVFNTVENSVALKITKRGAPDRHLLSLGKKQMPPKWWRKLLPQAHIM
jgi:hypothetical protein